MAKIGEKEIPKEYLFQITDYFKDNVLRSQVFIEKIPLKRLINEVKKSYYKIEIVSSNEDKYNIYRLKISKNIKISKSGQAIAIEKPGEYLILISNEKRKIWEQVILDSFKIFYSQLIKSFLKSSDIKLILDRYKEDRNIELYFKRFVAKSMFGETLKFTDVYYERLEKRPYIEAFKKVTAKGAWIHSIEIVNENKSIWFNINRAGEITIRAGSVFEILNEILLKEMDIYLDKNKFYSNRARKDTENKDPKVLMINFKDKVFANYKLLKQFIQKIEEYPNCIYSLSSSGNPFLYMNIIDRLDMSSFSIRTYKEDSLLLIPKIKTSSASLQRFSEYLIKNFMEGDTSDFSN